MLIKECNLLFMVNNMVVKEKNKLKIGAMF